MTGNTNKDKTPKRDERPRWKKKRWIVPAAVFAAFCWIYIAMGYPVWRYPIKGNILDDSHPANRVHYVFQPYSQRIGLRPFTQRNFVKKSPSWFDDLQYRQAFWQFPDLKHCLGSPSKSEEQPTVENFNWPALTGVKKIETCLYHLAAKLETPEQMQEWLQLQGFRVHLLASELSTNPSHSFRDPERRFLATRISAVWWQSDHGNLSPLDNFHYRKVRELLAFGGFQLSLTYDAKTNKLLNIEMYYRGK